MPKSVEKDAESVAFARRLVEILERAGQPRRGAGAYLARRYKVATVTANAWLNGEHKMEIGLARRIAEDHGSTFDGLYFGQANTPVEYQSHTTPPDGVQDIGNTRPGPVIRGLVPLISWVQAGEWSEAVDLHVPGAGEDSIPCPAPHSAHTYALRVEGDSMTSSTGKSYPHGSIIFVDPEQRGGVRPGDRVIARLKGDDQVTFKQLAEDRQGLFLKPLNSNHQPIYGDFSVLGKVIGKWEQE